MGKIIKYEFRKQRTARLIILFALLAGVIVFTVGILLDKENMSMASLALLLGFSFLSVLYTGVESLLVFNKDLRTRQSHMLWMIPRSVWEILGGKFVAAVLQMLFMFGVFAGAFLICLTVETTTHGGLKALYQAFQSMGQVIFGVDIDWTILVQIVILWFLFWTLIIMTGFLSIIISRTLLLNSRFCGLFSIILFFVINWFTEKGYSLLCDILKMSPTEINPPDILYYVAVCGILFAASGLLADKKLSV